MMPEPELDVMHRSRRLYRSHILTIYIPEEVKGPVKTLKTKKHTHTHAMTSSKSIGLLLCLLAGFSCDAFAVVRHEPSQFGVRRSRTLSSSPPSSFMTLSMVGGAAAAPPPPAELKPPPAMYEGAVAAGTAKASAPFGKIFKLGIVAGCHIAFGAYLSISVGGACPGLAESNPGLQKIIMVRIILYLS